MKVKEIELSNAIKRAVNEGLAAGYFVKQQEIKSYYTQTEKRLYSYSDLKIGIKAYKEEIKELESGGLPKKSKSIVFMPSGSRLDSDDLLDARIQDLYYRIQRNEREIKMIEGALSIIKNDKWYSIIEYKYLSNNKKENDEIAKILKCDESTIRRNKKRLISRLSIRFYGADAVC